MEFFTESVDAALWSSRTYDDPAYDDDPSAAAESRSAVSIETLQDHKPPSHLIVSVGAAADTAIEALFPKDDVHKLAALSGKAVPTRDLTDAGLLGGPADGCATLSATGVSDNRAVEWASAALRAAENAPVIVVTSVARGCLRLRREPGVRALSTQGVELEGVSPLCEPDFVAGAAAALLVEANWEGLQAICLIAVTERANFEADELAALAEAVCKAVTALGGNASFGDEARDRVNMAAKKAPFEAHQSIFL